MALTVGLLLVAGALLAALVRRPAMPRAAMGSILAGAALLALAAAGPAITWPEPQRVTVLVDRSASTRTASYREPQALAQRVGQLLGRTAHEIVPFSGDSADRTVLPAIDAKAIVLFSDGRCDVPSLLPPTYVVADPNLNAPADASIVALTFREGRAIAHVANHGQLRILHMGGEAFECAEGRRAFDVPLALETRRILAQLSPGDPWPENDALELPTPPAPQLQRWWIGSDPPAGDWKPATLPEGSAEYLGASIVVMNNVPADSLSEQQMDRLTQYVRDLGGGLVILGGDRAFGAGDYHGTALDVLSPLASSPPTPQRHWIVLIDASGSMAAASDGATRWQRALTAVKGLLPRLPPADLLTVGSFARDLRWFWQARPAAAARELHWPPDEVAPRGPTNLEPAIESLIGQLDGRGPVEFVIVSDADARIDDPASIASRLSQHRARLHLLRTADTPGSRVPEVARLTGGQVATELDPHRWPQAARELAKAIDPAQAAATPLPIQFVSETGLPARSVSPWNRTWLRRDATALATAQEGAEPLVTSARWQAGAGAVVAAAFAATSAEAEALAELVARPPRDPRFRIAWTCGRNLDVTVYAIDGDRYLNDLEVTVSLGAQREHRARQEAPGRYAISIDAPRQPALAEVRIGRTIVERSAVAGRFAPEFEAIGNDRDSMQKLAERTGGQVIEPAQTTPIDFNWPRRSVPMRSLLALIGAVLVGLGLAIWKLR